MPTQRLVNVLDQNGIHYSLISHVNTYTTAATGAITHIPGREIAKTVMVLVDGKTAMAIVPGSRHLDLSALKRLLQAKTIRLMTEEEFANKFPDCEVGAMPPLGVIYDIPVFVDERLARQSEIVFNAGSHHELLRITYKDFERLQRPSVLQIAAQTASERAQEERSTTGLTPYF